MGIFIEKQDSTVNTSSMYFDSPINKSTSFVKAKAPIKQGDMVRWNSSGGPATGKVTRIVAEGVIDVPDSKFKIKAEKDNPAVLINLFRAGKKTDIFVGHKMSTLKLSSMRKAEDLVKAEDDMNMVHQDGIMGGKKKKVMNAYGIEVEVDDDEEEIVMEDDKVEMGMGGYGYNMPKKKIEVLKHADHDQSSHGSWAGNSGGASGGSNTGKTKSVEEVLGRSRNNKKVLELASKLSDVSDKLKSKTSNPYTFEANISQAKKGKAISNLLREATIGTSNRRHYTLMGQASDKLEDLSSAVWSNAGTGATFDSIQNQVAGYTIKLMEDVFYMDKALAETVVKHAMHDQSSHGSWAGDGGGGSSGGGTSSGKFKRDSQKRPLSEIAGEIARDPAYKKMPSKIYAEAYVQPLRSMNDIEDNYFADTGVSVVSYALANLGSYRGDTARRVKSELKAMLKPNKGKSNNFIASKDSMDEPQYMGNEGKDFDSGQGRFI